ncbi:MAG TPA: hypothetical protein VG345_12400, partial [Bryobacteraceae bacterium]|nr:hypothetical protein [Bryobacteraceae bacterium]
MRRVKSISRIFGLLAFAALCAGAQQGWWMRQGWWIKDPIRLVQTNLRETDATLDPARLVNQLAD